MIVIGVHLFVLGVVFYSLQETERDGLGIFPITCGRSIYFLAVSLVTLFKNEVQMNNLVYDVYLVVTVTLEGRPRENCSDYNQFLEVRNSPSHRMGWKLPVLCCAGSN